MKRYLSFENLVIILLVGASLAGHLSNWSYYKKVKEAQQKDVVWCDDNPRDNGLGVLSF